MRFRLSLEYDGTRYSGWQRQNNSRTIQGELISAIERAFSKTKGDNRLTELQGSGRTDAGVHALEQIAHLECTTMLAPHILKMKVNDELPSDINILHISRSGDNFHARHSAVSRQYIYRISRRRTAFDKKYVWWVRDKLDLASMQEAAICFPGMHDFSSFAEPDKENKSTLVDVEELRVFEEEDLIILRIRASHFLWRMVRRITGTLVEAGRNKLRKEDIQKMLSDYSDLPSKLTAPPSGLFLEKVFY